MSRPVRFGGMCTALDMHRGHPNLTDPPNGVFVSSLTLKQLSDALRCLGWQPDKGALPRMGGDASPDSFGVMSKGVLMACILQQVDECTDLHGSLGLRTQGSTSRRWSMGLVRALTRLGLLGELGTARRARMPALVGCILLQCDGLHTQLSSPVDHSLHL